MNHELLFLNPVFNSGINVTVRKGDKWFYKAKVGHYVNCYKTGEVELGKMKSQGKIIGMAYLPCDLIPDELLSFEHDASCKTQEGLRAAMRKAYPDFQDDDLVTVIIWDATLRTR